ncbi:DndE family protein [Emticicia soli]|uniref:DndE family protein n=1 Tax=Emticicia soli TaxID=2027878 RepID=A0ABW5JFL6_9BACT
MFNNIKTSLENKLIVSELSRKLSLGSENIIARLAFAISLSKGEKLNLTTIKDSKGKEYSKNVLFGANAYIYVALICQHYNLYKTDKDIPKYIKMHIDEGLTAINSEFKDNPNLTGPDFLIQKIEEGLSFIF